MPTFTIIEEIYFCLLFKRVQDNLCLHLVPPPEKDKMMLQGSLCRSHLWRRIPFLSFGKHFLSCPQFGRCCRGLRGGRQSCRQSLRNVGSFAVFGGASCWPGSRSTKRCSPQTYDSGNKSLDNVIKLICISGLEIGRF